MLKTIIVSERDPAGMAILGELLGVGSFSEAPVLVPGVEKRAFVDRAGSAKISVIGEDQIYADSVNGLEGGFFIFASRHKAASGIPSLTAHPVGNFGRAEFGGRDFVVSPSSATFLRAALLELERQRDLEGLAFEVSLEATHHGPFLEKPAIFVELGSSEKQWGDLGGARAVARAVLALSGLSGSVLLKETGIALGGNHYGATFTKKLLNEECSFGHLAPKHALPFLSDALLAQALEKTLEPVKTAFLDWKGLGSEKNRVVGLCESAGLEVVKF